MLHEHQGRAEDDPRRPGAAHEVAEEELADHQGLVEPAQGVHHRQGLALSGALGGRLTEGFFSLVGSVTSARMPLLIINSKAAISDPNYPTYLPKCNF